MMKTMKACVFTVLLVLSVFAMTACGRTGNDQPSQSSPAQGTSSAQTGSSAESGGMGHETASGNINGSESADGAEPGAALDDSPEEAGTGVLNGLVDDVESGAEEIKDGLEDAGNHADESRD